jgi:hypothetical protein
VKVFILRVSILSLTVDAPGWMFDLARICAAGPDLGLFFGGFDFGFGEELAPQPTGMLQPSNYGMSGKAKTTRKTAGRPRSLARNPFSIL